MTDRVLNRCLWGVVMALIAGSAIASLLMIYSGLFRLIGGDYPMGGIIGASGAALAGGCYLLCKHSDDLIDRRRAVGRGLTVAR